MEQISTRLAFKRHARPLLAGLVLGLTLIWAQSVLAETPQPLETTSEVIVKEAGTCAQAIAGQERRNGIPKGLLEAISHAESGRWNAQNGAVFAWPWTVTTGGKGYFLPNRVDAVAFVKSLRADGVQNIDVGCMQINLMYHPDAFTSIEQSFDPSANAAYAANFLRERFGVSKSWLQAAGDYHSTTEDLNKAYREKVAKLWDDTKKAPAAVQVASVPVHTSVISSVPTNGAAMIRLASAQLPQPDYALTSRFNNAFRAHRKGGVISGPGQVIANRVRAMTPGPYLKQALTQTQPQVQTQAQPQVQTQAQAQAQAQAPDDGFQLKRQSQLVAWRKTRGSTSAATFTTNRSVAAILAMKD
jgi:hypothetical protein